MTKKKTYTKIPTPKGIVEGEDLSFNSVKEDWNIYDLEDGTRLKVKTILHKISKGIDPKTGGVYFMESGEPLYNVRNSLVVVAEVPKELMKEGEAE